MQNNNNVNQGVNNNPGMNNQGMNNQAMNNQAMNNQSNMTEQFSTLAFLLLFEGQKVMFFPVSSGKNINEIRLSRELGK